MTGEVSARTADDVEGAVLTYAEVKALASGNPLVMEKFKVDTEVKRLETLKSQHRAEIYRMQSEMSYLPIRIENLKDRIKRFKNDLSVRNVPSEFRIVIDGITYTDRKTAGSKIISKAIGLRGFEAYHEVGSYAGFILHIKTSKHTHIAPQIVAKGKAEHEGNISDSDIGTIQSLDYAIRSIEDKIAEMDGVVKRHEEQLESLKAEINKPFPYEEKLRELVVRQEQINKNLDLDKSEAIATEGEMAIAA
jgi:TolA-binding protein